MLDFQIELTDEVLERAPALRPFLLKMAKRAQQGKRLPASFTVRGLDYAAQGELEKLLRTILGRQADGAVYGNLHEFFREPGAWRTAQRVLGLGDEAARAESVADFLARLSWSLPEAKPLLDLLPYQPEVMRYLAKPEVREMWRRLLQGVWRLHQEGFSEPTTLSQLGSDWLNDSKSLRTGALRRQLVILLTMLSGRDVDERALLGTYGIYDNPYTSFVTFFAPVVLVMDDGQRMDFPAQLFAAGQACVLASETVAHLRAIEWQGEGKHLVTSENAAPFARYVAAGRPAVYTEGYPNSAVQRLLYLLGDAGVEADHAGDADFDGFRIAAMVGRCLTVRRTQAAEIVRGPGAVPGIALTEAQRARARAFLDRFPQMPYAFEIDRLLRGGVWYEQESFAIA